MTNDGTLAMTSGNVNGGPGNAWLFPLGASTPTLYNYGTLETFRGAACGRYFNVNVVNEARGAMDLYAGTNQLVGSWTITNDGTLNLGSGAVLNLVVNIYGDANLTEAATATTGVVVGGAATSAIDQFQCSAGACQHEAITVAGTLHVTPAGLPSGSYYPICSQQNPPSGAFAKVLPAGDTVTYGPDAAVVPDSVGGVIVTP